MPSPDDPVSLPDCEEQQVSDLLPALPDSPDTSAAVSEPLVPRRFSHDLVRNLRHADDAAKFANDPSGASDITVSAIAAVLCVGITQADALQATADWAAEAPHMQIHSIALAQMPGPVEETWEHHVTLTVSSRDPQTGEFDGSTHHIPRRGR
jgi:hypothetical protein